MMLYARSRSGRDGGFGMGSRPTVHAQLNASNVHKEQLVFFCLFCMFTIISLEIQV